LLLADGHGSARGWVPGRELAVPGHPGRERSTRRERSRLHRRTGRKLTRLLAWVAGRHAAWDSRPVKPGRTLPAGTADHGDLTRAGEATAVLAAVERP
jgi:hypothetical protein